MKHQTTTLEPTQELYWNVLDNFGKPIKFNLNRHKSCIETNKILQYLYTLYPWTDTRVVLKLASISVLIFLPSLEPTQELYWNYSQELLLLFLLNLEPTQELYWNMKQSLFFILCNNSWTDTRVVLKLWLLLSLYQHRWFLNRHKSCIETRDKTSPDDGEGTWTDTRVVLKHKSRYPFF